MPRYLQITMMGPPRTGAPDPEHMARVRASIADSIAEGRLLATGPIGKRATSAARVTLKDGKTTVEDPPVERDGTWMAAGGYAITEYASKEEAIEDCKRKMAMMGEGVMEIIQVGEMYPRPKAVALPGVIAHMTVSNASEASAFYAKAFGARELRREYAEDKKRLMHCHVEINGGAFMFADAFPEFGHELKPVSGCVPHLVVDDGQRWWDRAIAAGCTPTMPFNTAPWGDKYGQFKDPFGTTWAINQPAVKS